MKGLLAGKGRRERAILLVATLSGLGLVPFIPGTVGAAAGVGAALALTALPRFPALALIAGVALLGVLVSGRAEAILGERDPKPVVIDELAGQLLALWAIPLSTTHLLGGFILFRILDIVKPIRSLERLKGGWGVVADDLIAGALTNIILRLATAFSWREFI